MAIIRLAWLIAMVTTVNIYNAEFIDHAWKANSINGRWTSATRRLTENLTSGAVVLLYWSFDRQGPPVFLSRSRHLGGSSFLAARVTRDWIGHPRQILSQALIEFQYFHKCRHRPYLQSLREAGFGIAIH